MPLQELAQTEVNFETLKILLDHLSLVTIPYRPDLKLWLELRSFLVNAVHTASELMEEDFSPLQNIIQL
jgi:hypothetical protein